MSILQNKISDKDTFNFSAFPKWKGHPVQFLITATVNSNGYQTTIAFKYKIWKHICQRILKRHVWPIIWLFDVMNLSNLMLMSIISYVYSLLQTETMHGTSVEIK